LEAIQNFVVLGKTPRLLFAEDDDAVGSYVKHAAAAGDEFGDNTQRFLDCIRQTGGFGQVVSLRAVGDAHLHADLLFQVCAPLRREPAIVPPPGKIGVRFSLTFRWERRECDAGPVARRIFAVACHHYVLLGRLFKGRAPDIGPMQRLDVPLERSGEQYHGSCGAFGGTPHDYLFPPIFAVLRSTRGEKCARGATASLVAVRGRRRFGRSVRQANRPNASRHGESNRRAPRL
jgi:hypothetical protein